MDTEYWQQRWDEGRTGWHLDEVLPQLRTFWSSLGVADGARVLVPLCGKSLDMPWLAMQGQRVLGIDLAQMAIDAYLAEQGFDAITPETTDGGALYRAGPIQLLCADVFDVPPSTLATCTAIYDRAALFALPPDLRRRYVEHVYAALPAGACGLLVTLEYPQHEKNGPPFSVEEAELRTLLEPDWELTRLDRANILRSEPRFIEEGVTQLHVSTYRLRKRHAAGATED